MDPDDEIIVIMIFCWYWVSLASRINVERIKDLNSALTGHEYTQELLHGTSTQCHEMMRLSRDAFILLCNHFKQKNWVQSSRSISLEEKLAMFLMVIGHNERFRMVKRRFQHSTETIHRCFHEVLKAMMNFAREVIVPTSSYVSANNSERHRRLKEIFPGAIGALDGTLIHAIVPVDQQTRYRGRGKGECFQNVLAICDFDMIFTFVWAGWEGIAHDSRVLKEVAFNPNSGFPFPPPDKYYLCDAAYTNTRGFMTPYRGTRYWLADFRRQRALTKEERFNHAHAQLRNVIERAYGVLKARFPILKQMAPFSFPIQRDIVIACFAVHNFIRKCNIYDQLFMDYDENTMFHEMQSGENDGLLVQDIEWGSQGIDYMTYLRPRIGIVSICNPRGGARKGTAHTIEKLVIVEKQLTGKKFFNGETIGFLDLVFGWIAVYLEVVEETSGIKLLDEERFPLISAWEEWFSHIPVIEETLPDKEKLISKYQHMRAYFLSKAAAKKGTVL
ncbi:uncharacterized protein LOC110939140 [Helianthus annuus]|uniref:uncharacterized protein LOC110939140 n=1 Tax=Helianthus annuus TaxID=4232 RepID=UPI001652CA40|nr:uncharacterized protein LOC110939140 [Helianthus annuus]